MMDRDKMKHILFMRVKCDEDSSLGIPEYQEQIGFRLQVCDDEDLEMFRQGIQEAYAKVLGGDCVVEFDFEIEANMPKIKFSFGGDEPGIGS